MGGSSALRMQQDSEAGFFRPYRAWMDFGVGLPRAGSAGRACPGLFSFAPLGLWLVGRFTQGGFTLRWIADGRFWMAAYRAGLSHRRRHRLDRTDGEGGGVVGPRQRNASNLPAPQVDGEGKTVDTESIGE